MPRKFDQQFATPKQFTPDGLHVSRRAYSREEAAQIIQQTLRDEVFPESADDIVVRPEDLRASWVRWTFQDWSAELPSPCWMVCGKNEHGAQPTWELL